MADASTSHLSHTLSDDDADADGDNENENGLPPDLNVAIPQEGTAYHDFESLRHAVNSWSLREGFIARCSKKDTSRAQYRCRYFKDGCPWAVRASIHRNTGLLTVTSVNPKHTCSPPEVWVNHEGIEQRGKRAVHATQRWVVDTLNRIGYKPQVNTNPKEIVKLIQDRCGTTITDKLAHKSRDRLLLSLGIQPPLPHGRGGRPDQVAMRKRMREEEAEMAQQQQAQQQQQHQHQHHQEQSQQRPKKSQQKQGQHPQTHTQSQSQAQPQAPQQSHQPSHHHQQHSVQHQQPNQQQHQRPHQQQQQAESRAQDIVSSFEFDAPGEDTLDDRPFTFESGFRIIEQPRNLSSPDRGPATGSMSGTTILDELQRAALAPDLGVPTMRSGEMETCSHCKGAGVVPKRQKRPRIVPPVTQGNAGMSGGGRAHSSGARTSSSTTLTANVNKDDDELSLLQQQVALIAKQIDVMTKKRQHGT